MAVEITEDRLKIEGYLQAEDLEALDEALRGLEEGEKKPSVDLSECIHMHTGGVQMLMKQGLTIVAWPEASDWTDWIRSALSQ